MNIEQLDIRGHLAQFAPFDHLSDELLDRIAGSIEIRYFQAGSELLSKDQPIDSLWYIRSGAVEMYQRSGRLFNRLGEGDIFGYSDLLHQRRVRYPVRAIEDTLIYFVPAEIFDEICEVDDDFSEFVDTGGRLKVTVQQQRDDSGLMTTRVRKLITRQPQMVEADTTLQAAAQRMRDENTTCVLVVDLTESQSPYTFVGRDGRHWKLNGILTDRDFCTRVLAEGKSPQTPVGEVMSSRPIVIQSDESVYEAMLCMLRNQVHHLPVLHRRQPMGILHLSDIVRHETHSSLFLVNNLRPEYPDPALPALHRGTQRFRAHGRRRCQFGDDQPRPGHHRTRFHPAPAGARRGRTGAAAGALLLHGARVDGAGRADHQC